MDSFKNAGSPEAQQEYKVWRQKSDVQRACEELAKCHVDAKLVNLCRVLISGKRVGNRDIVDEKNDNKSLFSRGDGDALLDIPSIDIPHTDIKIVFESLSWDEGKTFHFNDPQNNNKYISPNKKVDNFFRTILPAQNNLVSSSNGRLLTPVTFILPTGEPIVESELTPTGRKSRTKKKVTSTWKHLVIEPEPSFKDKDNSLVIAQRLSSLFVLLGITSMLTEQSNKSNFFQEICSLSSFLKDNITFNERDIDFKNGTASNTDTEDFSEALRKLKYSKNYKFKHLQILKSRVNDPDCAWRDIDKISSALANLSVLTSATAITFYVDNDNDQCQSENDLPSSPYLVVPETIHDMFLDARDFCEEMNKYYTCVEHGGASRRQIMKKLGVKMSVSEKEIFKIRDDQFNRNSKRGSISGKIPNLKNGWSAFQGAEKIKITNFRTSLGFDTCYLFNQKFDTEGTKFLPDLIITPPVPYRYKWVDI